MTYLWSRTCPGPTWRLVGEKCAMTPGGQLVWRNRLWKRCPWRIAALWIAAAGVFALVAFGLAAQ